MDTDSIADRIRYAIEEANTRYEEMSGGDWLIDAVTEGFMQAVVAGALFNAIDDCTVVVEGTPFSFHRSSSMTTAYQKYDDYSRFDIGVRDSNGNLIYIIELKRKWDTQSASADLRRIANFHKNWGETGGGFLRGGFFTFTVATGLASTAHYLGTRKDSVKKSANVELKKLGYKTEVRFGDPWTAPYDGYAKRGRQREGCAACIQMTSSELQLPLSQKA